MGKVNVVVVDATGNKEQKVGLPDDIKCGIIMVKLVEKIKLPSVGPDGNPISYKFIHKVTGRQLLETQTLAEAGIKDGDVLRLQPEITAGAVCNKCGAEVNGNATFCTSCGCLLLPVAEKKPIEPEQPAAKQKSKPTIEKGAKQSEVKQKDEKKCMKCGAVIKEGTAFCTECGAAIEEKTVQVNEEKVDTTKFSKVEPASEDMATKMNNKISKGNKFFPIAGIISGILSFIFGIVVFNMNIGIYESSSTYGGDAYTGIQNAAATTANNLLYLAKIAKNGFGFLLMAIGLIAIFYFAMKIPKKEEL